MLWCEEVLGWYQDQVMLYECLVVVLETILSSDGVYGIVVVLYDSDDCSICIAMMETGW